MGLRRFSPHRTAQMGSVSLEFVILLPFLIMILVGILDLSLLMYDKAALATAARVAVRAGTMVSVPAMTTTQVAAVATANVNNSLISSGVASPPTVTVTHASGTNPGNPLTVQISYTYKGLFLGSALSALTGPVVLNATAVMNYE
ncbi:TadE family protein [Caballeronia sp. J97]|uniref:TadE family protein n=1 Tax=Caballeronia sp. J97 TaxID=2805429 RepID=UPI002AB26860|nr:TadE family protein [Caballeronia sp. J97]